MRQITIHMVNYIDVTTTNILSPDILPVEDLRSMLRHIEFELLSTIHLPIPSDYTLHSYWYLNTHVLITEGQFLLLINVPIQNRAQNSNKYMPGILAVLSHLLALQRIYILNFCHYV